MKAVGGQHGDDEERGRQVFVHDDDGELGKEDLGRGDGQGDKEIQVPGEIKRREDVVEAEDEDQELAREDRKREEGRLLAEGSEEAVEEADALEIIKQNGAQPGDPHEDQNDQPEVAFVFEKGFRPEEGQAEIDPEADPDETEKFFHSAVSSRKIFSRDWPSRSIARSSSSVPWAISRPRSMMPIRSQSFSATSMM